MCETLIASENGVSLSVSAYYRHHKNMFHQDYKLSVGGNLFISSSGVATAEPGY